MDSLTASLVAAFAISLGWTALSLRLGPALRWVDLPDRQPGLSVHDRPAVPLGGIGIFLAVHAAMAMTGSYDVGLALATGVVLILGLADDKLDLDPRLRLAVEAIAGLLLVTQATVGVRGWWGLIVGTALVVVTINAVNLFDGLDGLVASTAVVTALGVAWLTDLRVDAIGDGSFGLVVAAASLGFLVFNWNPARAFLGDNGAYTVAVLIAYGILRAADRSTPLSSSSGAGGLGLSEMVDLSVWVGMGLLGVFVVDLVVTLLRRWLRGRPLFQGDRSHVYDQLRDRGMGVGHIALTAAGSQAVLVVIVVAADRLLGDAGAVIALLALLATLLAVANRQGFLRVDG